MSILWDSVLSDRSAEVFDLLPLGICVFDRDLTISFWNRTLADWTDIPACDIVGQRLSDRYPILDTPRFNSRPRWGRKMLALGGKVCAQRARSPAKELEGA